MQSGLRRVAAASFIGTAIEFYDFFAYGTAAALVLNRAFFPQLSPAAGTLAAFSTYAVAFLARPLGAALFGHFGDRLGRKSMLVLSLLMMGGATVLIGVLPGYRSIGAWAPALLVALRVVQGLGLGGEWGGAVLLAVESAPPERRGRAGGFPQLGPSAGFFASTGAFWLLSVVLDKAAFDSWGWRLPFLASTALLVTGLVVRLRIAETPVFAGLAERRETSRRPLLEVLRGSPRQVLLGAGVMAFSYALFYISSSYCLVYLTTVRAMPRRTALSLALVAIVCLAAGTWTSAGASDRLGRRVPVRAATAAAGLWSLALFPLLDSGSVALTGVGLAVAGLLNGALHGPIGAFLPELFAARVRYSGAAVAYNLGGVVGGGAAPLLAIRLQPRFGADSVGWMLAGLAVVSLLCLARLPETAGVAAEEPAAA
ncbi:MFS transporter [Mangrovactinospora gilvigrisea]|uniref:Putative proline/betaine transporter n=1 Tax=Mangrovactinospora gilvigrisea TaxID=1428644 RepID=A0A1J7B9P6_9ACTN|nr:MFS transporter [Mangrovactinospora gilvigrisea]OIV35399.1 MFS transporter [Mangrovactinospora gilvigrisea]